MMFPEEPVKQKFRAESAIGDPRSSWLNERLIQKLPSHIQIQTEFWDHRDARLLGLIRNLNFALRWIKNERKRELELADQRYRDLLESEWMPVFRETEAVLKTELGIERNDEIKTCLLECQETAKWLREHSAMEIEMPPREKASDEPYFLETQGPEIDIEIGVVDGVGSADVAKQIIEVTEAWLNEDPKMKFPTLLRIFDKGGKLLVEQSFERRHCEPSQYERSEVEGGTGL